MHCLRRSQTVLRTKEANQIYWLDVFFFFFTETRAIELVSENDTAKVMYDHANAKYTRLKGLIIGLSTNKFANLYITAIVYFIKFDIWKQRQRQKCAEPAHTTIITNSTRSHTYCQYFILLCLRINNNESNVRYLSCIS